MCPVGRAEQQMVGCATDRKGLGVLIEDRSSLLVLTAVLSRGGGNGGEEDSGFHLGG